MNMKLNHPSFLRKEKEVPDQIKAEWLGVEARVHLPPRMLARKFIDRRRRTSIGRMLFSFLSGIAMGGYLAFFVNRGAAGSVIPGMR